VRELETVGFAHLPNLDSLGSGCAFERRRRPEDYGMAEPQLGKSGRRLPDPLIVALRVHDLPLQLRRAGAQAGDESHC
jgi:hypothetical protein